MTVLKMTVDVSQKVDYDKHLVDDMASIGYGPLSLLQSGSRVEQMHPWRANSFWLAWHRQIPCRLEPEKRHWAIC